jgi:hypothetical protein
MKITKSQLRQLIKEEVNEIFAGYTSGGHPSSNVRGSSYGSKKPKEEYEVKIGKDVGRNTIESTRVHVMASSREEAKEKAKEHPEFIRGGYEYAMLAAPGFLDDYKD